MTDIRSGDWVDRFAPAPWRPYLRLARLDRPIGTWLLLFPGWWGIALAAPGWPDWKLIALFGIGAMVMRGAGCTFNDIADRDFDKAVERTRVRPIPSGQVSVRQAALFMAGELAAGALVLVCLNRLAIDLGFAVLLLIVDLSLHEAGDILAAIFSRTQFQLGRADGLCRGQRRSGLALLSALCRRHRLDPRLRHHLRAPGQGGRRADRREVFRPGARTEHAAFLVRVLRRGGGLVGGRGVCGGPRILVLARAWLLAAAQMAWQAGNVALDDSGDCLAKFKSNRAVGWLVLAGITAAHVL